MKAQGSFPPRLQMARISSASNSTRKELEKARAWVFDQVSWPQRPTLFPAVWPISDKRYTSSWCKREEYSFADYMTLCSLSIQRVGPVSGWHAVN